MNIYFVDCYEPALSKTLVLHKRTFPLYNDAVISPVPKEAYCWKGLPMEITLSAQLDKLLDAYSHV